MELHFQLPTCSPTAIRELKPGPRPIKKSDAGGLFILVTPEGSKQKLLSGGPYPLAKLADARTSSLHAGRAALAPDRNGQSIPCSRQRATGQVPVPGREQQELHDQREQDARRHVPHRLARKSHCSWLPRLGQQVRQSRGPPRKPREANGQMATARDVMLHTHIFDSYVAALTHSARCSPVGTNRNGGLLANVNGIAAVLTFNTNGRCRSPTAILP